MTDSQTKQNQSNRSSFPLARAITAAAILISVLQGIIFALKGPAIYNIIAIGLAAGTLIIAWRYFAKSDTRLTWVVLVLLCTQLCVFVFQFVTTEPPLRLRTLQVALFLSYLATGIAVLLASARLLRPSSAFLLAFSIALALLVGEIAVGLLFSPKERREKLKGAETGGDPALKHPTLGFHFAPHSVRKGYYPDNPRGYFRLEPVEEQKWKLSVNQESTASLVFPPGQPAVVRVAIEKAGMQVPWEIHLSQPQLSVKGKWPYAVRFRARADSPRGITVAVSQAHEPWKGLGLSIPWPKLAPS